MNVFLRYTRRVLDAVYLAAAVLAALCLAAIALLILAQVVGRWFGLLLPSAEEFAGFLMAASTFLALAWTLRTGGHIRVNILVRHLAPRARHWQEVLACTVLLALSATLTWSAIAFVRESFAFGDVSSGYIAVPLWIPQLPMATGLAILTLALADDLLSLAAGGLPSWHAEERNTV